MGCCDSKLALMCGTEKEVRKAIHIMKFDLLRVGSISKALYTADAQVAVSDYLTSDEISKIEKQLDISLPLSLFQDHEQDPRISRRKLFIALVLMSGDPADTKSLTIHRLLSREIRDVIRFVEWGLELRFCRLVREAGKLGTIEPEKWVSLYKNRVDWMGKEVVALAEEAGRMNGTERREVFKRFCRSWTSR